MSWPWRFALTTTQRRSGRHDTAIHCHNGSYLLTRGLASGTLTCCLLGACHGVDLVDACLNECEIDFLCESLLVLRRREVAVKTYVISGTRKLQNFGGVYASMVQNSTWCDSIEFSLGCFCFSEDSDSRVEIYVCFVLQLLVTTFFMWFGVAVASLFFVGVESD